MLAKKIITSSPIYILIKHGQDTLFEKTFDSYPITLGRSLNCDIPLPQFSWISRQHLVIDQIEGKFFAQDLNSANGMIFHGKPCSHIELHDGTLLQVNSISIVFGIGVRHQEDIEATKKIVLAHLPSEEPKPPYPERLPHIPIPETAADQQPEFTQSISVVTSTSLHIPEIHELPTPTPETRLHVAHEEIPRGLLLTSYEHGRENLHLNQFYPTIDRVPRAQRVLEASVTWRGVVYDTQIFRPGENIRLGAPTNSETTDLYIPTLYRSQLFGLFDGSFAHCHITPGMRGQIQKKGQAPITLEQLVRSQALPRRGGGYSLRLGASEICTVDFGYDVSLHLRYIQAPRQLTKMILRQPDQDLQQTLTASAVVHLLFVLMVFLVTGKPSVPEIKNVPPRVARLLIQKAITPPPQPPKKVVAEEPQRAPPKPRQIEKRVPPKPKKVVIKTNTEMKKVNKFPYVVKSKMVSETKVLGPQKPVTKDVNELGALAALGALGAPSVNPQNKPIAINVNPNAGGQAGSMSGMIGALSAKGGKLAPAGISGVKTTGKGFGTGTGYGVQGLKGTAGSRGVAGAVVGTPKLMTIERSEGLTQKQVMDVVKQHVGEIQQCYERSLLSTPGIAGRVEYEWHIQPSGQVKWAKVKRSDVASADALNECVTAIFKKMKFPVAKNGESTVPTIGFPFGRL